MPKTALAGVMLEISFARFSVSTATFNTESVPSRPSRRRVIEVIVGEMEVVKTPKLPGAR